MRPKFKPGLGPDSRVVRTLEKHGISLHPAHVRDLQGSSPKERREFTSALISLGKDMLERAKAPRLEPARV